MLEEELDIERKEANASDMMHFISSAIQIHQHNIEHLITKNRIPFEYMLLSYIMCFFITLFRHISPMYRS